MKPDVHTVQQYLKFLTQSYLFSKAARYDVKGRRYMQYPCKWYAEDVGLRKTREAFRKLVVVGGDQPFFTDDDGISFVGVIPFLLDKSILSGMTSGMA